jgi:NAD(P)H-dependent flavin oxidoreductase YrpB (nitropropane dioxygenase family)
MKIGNLDVEIPVVQGGMGVGVSLSGLAGAVASCGGVGVISTAQIGFKDPEFAKHPIETNLKTIGREIKKAREIASENNSHGGVIGVNIMVVTRRYEDYVRAAVTAGADIIISGAGLPMELPGLVEGSDTKIAPIVSGKRALTVIMRYWQKHYGRKPDMVVIEGPQAGGHLGFSREEIASLTREKYDEEIKAILDITQKEDIPTVVGGGVYTREDMERYMALGADGVQMATRFVTTYECDAHMNYKQAYIDAKKEDIEIVSSPVGMPGRAIHNEFLDRVAAGERFMNGCRQCITTCNPLTSPYCITEALINAVEGRCSEGLLFCGSNAYRAERLERVSDIMEEFRL